MPLKINPSYLWLLIFLPALLLYSYSIWTSTISLINPSYKIIPFKFTIPSSVSKESIIRTSYFPPGDSSNYQIKGSLLYQSSPTTNATTPTATPLTSLLFRTPSPNDYPQSGHILFANVHTRMIHSYEDGSGPITIGVSLFIKLALALAEETEKRKIDNNMLGLGMFEESTGYKSVLSRSIHSPSSTGWDTSHASVKTGTKREEGELPCLFISTNKEIRRLEGDGSTGYLNDIKKSKSKATSKRSWSGTLIASHYYSDDGNVVGFNRPGLGGGRSNTAGVGGGVVSPYGDLIFVDSNEIVRENVCNDEWESQIFFLPKASTMPSKSGDAMHDSSKAITKVLTSSDIKALIITKGTVSSLTFSSLSLGGDDFDKLFFAFSYTLTASSKVNNDEGEEINSCLSRYGDESLISGGVAMVDLSAIYESSHFSDLDDELDDLDGDAESESIEVPITKPKPSLKFEIVLNLLNVQPSRVRLDSNLNLWVGEGRFGIGVYGNSNNDDNSNSSESYSEIGRIQPLTKNNNDNNEDQSAPSSASASTLSVHDFEFGTDSNLYLSTSCGALARVGMGRGFKGKFVRLGVPDLATK